MSINSVGIGTTNPIAPLHVEGNSYITGTISAGNLGMFRNRIINGDIRVDQKGSDGSTGTGALTGSFLTYNTPPSSYYTVDRFAIAAPNIGNPVVKKVLLNSTDILTTGFTTAASIGLVPTDSLMAYFPFESNISDASGQNVVLTSALTPQYVPSGVVGTQALYFPNEANVGGTGTNYLSCQNFIFPNTFTVSMWAMNRAISATANCHIFVTNSASTALTNSIVIYYQNTSGTIRVDFWGVIGVAGITPVLYEWTHVAVTYNNGTLSIYTNGVFGASTTGTMAQAGFTLGAGTSAGAGPFGGYIDDFRIYSRVLGASEIAALAKNIGIPTAPPIDSSWITQITLDNTVADARGGLPAPNITGNTIFTPVCKTGTHSIDLTANNAGGVNPGTTAVALTYTLSSGSYTPPFTFMGWFNTKVTNVLVIPFCIGNNTASQALTLQVYVQNTARLVYDLYVAGAFYSINPSITINTGTWCHVAMSLSSTSTNSGYVNYYLNGLLVGSRTIPAGFAVYGGSGTPNQLRIGASTGTGFGWNFQGYIDDVRIYNRFLTSREIAGIYNASQYASYTLFKQPIEANNIYDIGWGTNAAQPLSLSMWIKNNTSNAQSFSVSLQNAGANLIAWMPFENSVNDVLGFLNNSSNYAAPLSTSVYKVGTASLDFSGNIAGGAGVYATSRRISYNVPFSLQLPLTVSCWIYAQNVSTLQVPWSLATYGTYWVTLLGINGSGQLYVDLFVNNTQSTTPGSVATSISANTWYHTCVTYNNGVCTLYINGNSVSTITYTATGVLSRGAANNYNVVNNLSLGVNLDGYAFKGYIDDFRIYNVPLSQITIAQLYSNNANTTVSSTYLLPRSVVYNTPTIPISTWQRVALTIPGETTSSFLPNIDTGLTMAICLGATFQYDVGSNLAATTNNTSSVWNTAPYYMGASNQLYCYSESNFLANITNSVLITGVQLEKGSIVTPFEFRPYGMEYNLSLYSKTIF